MPADEDLLWRGTEAGSIAREVAGLALTALGCGLLAYASLRWSPLTGHPILDAAGGLALAAMLVQGYRAGWAIGLGAALGHWLWAAEQPACGHDDCALWTTAIVHAAAMALQAVLGTWLLRRSHAASTRLAEPREILAFVVNGAAWPALASAAVTTVYHAGFGNMPWAAAPMDAAGHWVGAALGVMVGAPIVLAWAGQPRRDWAPRRWPMTLTGVTSAVLVHLGVAAVADADARRTQNEFDHSAQLAVALAKAELHSTLQAVRAMQIFFSQSREVSDGEFRVATSGWLSAADEAQAIGWVDCQNRQAQGPLQPTVRYIEPGFYRPPDLGPSWFTEAAVQEALVRALQSGRPAASSSISIGPTAGGRAGAWPSPAVVVFQSAAQMWRPGVGCDHGVRGLVFATLPLPRLAKQLNGSIAPPLALCLVDRQVPQPGHVLLGADDCETATASRRHVEALAIGDRRWDLVVFDKSRSEGRGTDIVAGVSVGGMLGAAALMIMLLTVTGRARRIEDAVAEAEAARRTAEAANLAKSSFLSRMSHELRTPLNAVLGFAQLLETATNPALAPNHKRWALNIRQAGDHLLAMINDILDLSRIESDTVNLTMGSLAVDALVAESVTLIEQRAAQRRITIRVALEPQAQRLRGDATRVRQVMANLLSNAVKYNREGGEVQLIARRLGPVIEIEVRDTGMGLTATQLAQLFQPFNRLGRESGPIEGTGIGLVISRKLAALMGGTLTVASTLETGSSFTLALPADDGVVGRPAPGEGAGAGQSAQSAQSAQGPVPALPAQRIHYVEDNPLNVEIVRAALAGADGIQLDHSATGQQCLDSLHRPGAGRPDLILLDLHLPDVDGLALLRRLKADPATADMPVVVVTADALEVTVETAMACGAAEFLTKPIDVLRLRRTLARHGRAVVPPAPAAAEPAPIREA